MADIPIPPCPCGDHGRLFFFQGPELFHARYCCERCRVSALVSHPMLDQAISQAIALWVHKSRAILN